MSMTAHLNNLRFSLKILDSSFFGRGRVRARNFGHGGRDGMFLGRGVTRSLWWWAGVVFGRGGRHNGYLVVGLEDATACRALC